MTIYYICIAIFIVVFIPGLIVHFNSLRFLRKKGETDAVWQSLSPVTVLLTACVALPVYTAGFYMMLFAPKDRRKPELIQTLRNVENTSGDLTAKQSIIYGLAITFGIDLDK